MKKRENIRTNELENSRRPVESQLVDCSVMGGFGDQALEVAYRKSFLVHSRGDLINLLCICAIALLALAFTHINHPDIFLLITSLLALIALLLQTILLVRPVLLKFCFYSTLQLLVLVSFWFYPSGHSSLFSTSIIIFSIYSLVPLSLKWSLLICIPLSVLQIIVLALVISPLSVNQFLATIVIHAWTHFISVYANLIRDRISRSAFIRARNALNAEQRVLQENSKQTELFCTAVPSHLISNVREQLNKESPLDLYTEHYSEVTVLYGRIIEIENIYSQCSVQDSARLLSELNSRIHQIAKKNDCLRLHADGILVVSGIPRYHENHAEKILTFALDVQSLLKSFCDSTTAEIGFRCSIESGAVSCGIVGSTKWHYDMIGLCIDEAINCVRVTPECGIFVGESAKKYFEDEYKLEVCGQYWRVVPAQMSTLPPGILFPNLRRFSLITIPQAINRLLQTIFSTTDSLLPTNAQPGRRKKKGDQLIIDRDKYEIKDDGKSLIRFFAQTFTNAKLEDAFHAQIDPWFLSAIAIGIFFFVVYGVYHILVLPKQFATLFFIIIALVVMFAILIMIYLNFFQSFNHFITRTSFGHSTAILFILALLFFCGIVNVFSCPQESDADPNSECFMVHFPLFSCVFWMLATVPFVRFPSLVLLTSLLASFIVYSFHAIFIHSTLYYNYSRYTNSSHFEVKLLLGLLVLAIVIYLQARRNERILKLDFLSKLKEVEEKAELKRLEEQNQRLLQNALPLHVAQSFNVKSDLYHHFCHSAGVAYIHIFFNNEGNETESDINDLRNIISMFDQVLTQYRNVEKIKHCQKYYVVAVGIAPETNKNVHDTPSTIGDLLSELTQFALAILSLSASHGVTLNIGIDCGSVMSVVVSSRRPHYEVVGKPCVRARTLMDHADCFGVMVSEEIYLALRPRNFTFDSRFIRITSNLNAYVFDDCCITEDSTSRSVSLAADYSSFKNQIGSMNSSLISDVCSIDIGAETDSDMEWITPETFLFNNKIEYPSTSGVYMSQGGLPHSTAMLQSNQKSSEYKRHRYKKGLRSCSWMSRSMTSESRYTDGAERLAAAANRVDRMLEELNAVADLGKPENPFPTALSVSTKSLRKEMSSACRTEYDNAESDGICSESEVLDCRLEHLKKALKQCRASSERRRKRRFWEPTDNGNDADVDSLCSSLNVSSIFGNLRWNSVHSIGYEDEYEIASREDLRQLARSQMEALSRDIRKNFGDYHLSTFSDIDA